jgi:hypothetical protein
MPTKTRSIVIPARGDSFRFVIPLPVTDWDRRRAEREAQDLVGLCLNESDLAAFASRLDYLPTTAEELAKADAYYADGMDWHTACARARGKATCPCIDCQPTKGQV